MINTVSQHSFKYSIVTLDPHLLNSLVLRLLVLEPMVFQGEEIFQGLRGFTYGYDYYTAEISVAFHMYAIKENLEKRKKVRMMIDQDQTIIMLAP
jgi:hypothetical protein